MNNLIGQHLGQYEIVSVLGSGGMATVYLAKQITVNRTVAIKVIDPKLAQMSQDFIQRFKREAETIAKLSHPNILKLFDYGQDGHVAYLVTEFLSGGNLAQVLHQGALSREDIQRIIDQIASALDYAHSKGIIHRDLKPQNILFDETGHALLADFGIAKIIGEATSLTQTGATMGTPVYMSPEQCSGQDLDARTDIYSLGVILFEMLAGRVPFLADTPLGVIYMHINQPVPVDKLPPGLPQGVWAVLEKALAKNPDQRFSSAAELAKNLQRALADESIPAIVDGTQTVVLTPIAGSAGAGNTAKNANQRMISVLALLVVIGGIIGLAAILLGRNNQSSATLPSPTVTNTPIQTQTASLTFTPSFTFTNTATSTATLTNTPTLTLTPTQVTVMITMTSDLINLRAGPGTNYEVVGQARKTDQLTVIAQTGSGIALWYLVTTTDKVTGWVLAKTVSVMANAIIPAAVTIPASPVFVTTTRVAPVIVASSTSVSGSGTTTSSGTIPTSEGGDGSGKGGGGGKGP